MYTHVYTHTHKYTQRKRETHMHTRTYIQTHSETRIYMHMHTYTQTHTYMHTHLYGPPNASIDSLFSTCISICLCSEDQDDFCINLERIDTFPPAPTGAGSHLAFPLI